METQMENQILVTKRDGSTEVFNPEKLNNLLKWATEGIGNVSASDIAIRTKLMVSDGITSDEIHKTLVDSSVDLISESNPNYSKVAARLFLYHLRKKVWGGKNAPKLYDHIKSKTQEGVYSKTILEKYTKSEIDKIDEMIDHSRDEFFDYGGLLQLTEKYLVQNRKTDIIFETPQFMFMLIGMTVFQNEKTSERKTWLQRFYNESSKFNINIPTPILGGARTTIHSYSSCCLIDVKDTKNSLFAANTTAGLVTCDRYGTGLNLSNLRPINSPVRGGETLHSGVIPWLKIYQDTISACQQGGPRRGACTVTFPLFHQEISTILELKNNQGTHENRVPHLDYSIGVCSLFWKRFLVDKGDITLFSSQEIPELFDAFGTEAFEPMYLEAEKRDDLTKTKISAKDVFTKLFIERLETGRIYIMNMDHCNDFSPWKDTVHMSNLCQEILQPLKAEEYTNDPNAEIGVCVLGATNMLNMKTDKIHKNTCELLVRFLDNIIEIQDYTVKACENFAINKRSLGIGISNLSGYLASKGLNHLSPESPQVYSDFMEKQQYYLMEASMELAKERGQAPHFERSKYFKAEKTPLDLYSKNLDKIVEPNKLDWKPLMEDIAIHGMRNMTVSAQMPAESSSVTFGTTNGQEPITKLITRKSSKGKTSIVIAPHIVKWGKHYTLKHEITDNKPIIELCSAGTKWLCMASSFNLYYNSSQYDDGNVPLSVMVKDHAYATHLGMPTFYYANSVKKKDGLADESEIIEVEENDQDCSSGSCAL